MTSDLATSRALAERTRENTADGLAAREALPDVVDALASELEHVRSLRLARPADAVDPARHTPERVRAHLEARGWTPGPGGRVAEFWHHTEEHDKELLVPLIPTAPDYAKVLGLLASDLADAYGVGELQVLKDIAEAGDAQSRRRLRRRIGPWAEAPDA